MPPLAGSSGKEERTAMIASTPALDPEPERELNRRNVKDVTASRPQAFTTATSLPPISPLPPPPPTPPLSHPHRVIPP